MVPFADRVTIKWKIEGKGLIAFVLELKYTLRP